MQQQKTASRQRVHGASAPAGGATPWRPRSHPATLRPMPAPFTPARSRPHAANFHPKMASSKNSVTALRISIFSRINSHLTPSLPRAKFDSNASIPTIKRLEDFLLLAYPISRTMPPARKNSANRESPSRRPTALTTHREPEAGAAPSLLQPQNTDETVRSVRFESANSVTDSYCHRQSESASDAPGSQCQVLRAPKTELKASAANSTPGARSQTPEAAAAPSLLQPQKLDETVRSVRLESANRATEPCCHGQSESVSDARGSQSYILQAPKAAPKASAASSTTEAGSRKPAQPPPSYSRKIPTKL